MIHRFPLTRACAFVLLTVAACASSGPAWHNKTYRFRANPGPTDWETQYSFARGGLAIRAHGATTDGTPIFHFVVQNHGSSRVSFQEAMFTIRGGEPSRGSPVELRNDLDDRVAKLTILARDETKFSVRSRVPLTLTDGSLVLEVRGVRDDSGDGGYDFDLFGQPLPADESGARGTTKPEADKQSGRRDLRDQNSIQTPSKDNP
jgi:hypothetical protein